jgi:hypothetical protein
VGKQPPKLTAEHRAGRGASKTKKKSQRKGGSKNHRPGVSSKTNFLLASIQSLSFL